jgi:DNA polymerase-3 subunit gamma/tau
MDVMEDHIRWLAGDAGIELDDTALQSVLRQGGGSARDTVSALELVAASGGAAIDAVPLDEFIEAFIEHDPGRALTVVAMAVQQGRDPRTLADDLIRHLRDLFLSLMAPELVQLTTQRSSEVSELASRMGAGAIVKAMERLGEMLVEMRHAPDPRLLLEVALVQLTHQASNHDVGALLDRIERLEQQVASGPPTGSMSRPAPVDPATGMTVMGGRARRDSTNPLARPGSAPKTAPTPAVEAPAAPVEAPAPVAATPTPPAAPAAAPAPASGNAAEQAVAAWGGTILPSLKGLGRALFAATKLVGVRDGAVVVAAPNEAHRARCEQQVADLRKAIVAAVHSDVPVVLVVDGAIDHDDQPPLAAPAAATPPPPPDEEVDLTELVDVPPEQVRTTDVALLEAFPGSKFIEE